MLLLFVMLWIMGGEVVIGILGSMAWGSLVVGLIWEGW